MEAFLRRTNTRGNKRARSNTTTQSCAENESGVALSREHNRRAKMTGDVSRGFMGMRYARETEKCLL